MRTLSRVSNPSVILSQDAPPPVPVSDSPELMLAEGGHKEMDQSFLTPHRSSSRSHPARVGSTSSDEVETVASPMLGPGSPVNLFNPPRSAPVATHTGTGSRITFSSQAQADLGRSPSGRRPLFTHRASQSSANGPGSAGPSRLFSPVPASNTAPSIRSSSAFSHQRRDRSSSSLSAAQQALLREVMEEERIASQSAREAERAGLETEREEVRKERERSGGQPLPPATPTIGSGDLRRRGGSISSSTAPGTGSGGDIRRAATSARPGSGGGVGNAAMVALAAHRFAAGRSRRSNTMSGAHQSPLGMGDRERSGSGAMSGRAGSGSEGGNLPTSATTPRTVIQAQLEQPRAAVGVSGDTSGSSRTGAAGGVGGLAGLGT